MLIVLAELVLIASIRRINYVVTLAIIDVLITCLCQLARDIAHRYLVKHNVSVKVCFRRH